MIRALFAKIDNRAYVIHSEKRKDREHQLETWSKAEGVKVNMFPAIMMADGREGCAASHTQLAKLLKQQGANGYHLILEDDVVPRQIPYENLSELFQAMDANEFDVIWLGSLPMPWSRTTRWNSIRSGTAWSTYGLLVNQRALDFLSQFKWNGVPIDVELARAPLRGAWVYPELFAQAQGPSNVRSTSLTRLDAFGDLMQLYMPLWRALVFYKQILCILLISVLVVIFATIAL